MKAISFSMNCFTLLIIPSTEFFVKIMQDNYRNNWNCIVSYIGDGLILPIILIYLMVLNKVSDIKEKYNIAKYGFFNYYYIEIIDIIKQVVYALFAAYDVYYGCILLEIFWVILIISLLPYKKKSEYSLSLGNSLIMFISNGAMIYSSLKNNAVFSNAVSIVFVIISCIPAVASLYVYFIYDFEVEVKTENESDELNEVKTENESDELNEINKSQNQLEQSEIFSANDNSQNQLSLKDNDDNSINQQKDNDDNSINQQIENDDNSKNDKLQKINKAFEDMLGINDNMIVGNDSMIDNIANSIKAITPIAFFFYGLSVSLFSKSNRL